MSTTTTTAQDEAAGPLEHSAIVESIIRSMTLDEKLAQLVGVWVDASTDGDGVAPMQNHLAGEARTWSEIIADGLGQITRMYGTKPIDPVQGARSLAASQREIMAASRFGIPAQVHEECLAGLAAWKSTAYPVPLAWGASFDPDTVEEMARRIGAQMRDLGVHQGLAPVLDVVRDLRWGRVEETIGEDPYLVGTLATSYVRGLEQAGIVSTLKHFVGYSASQAGRNHAPVSMGPREVADVMLLPFEMAVKLGAARSVMHAYTAIDGVPAAADRELLTTLLRDDWGFDGTVVADYFGISFLELTHRLVGSPGEAADAALTAGVDVELPTVNCYGAPLRERVLSGATAEELVDRALRRVLMQKAELGLLDADFDPEPPLLRRVSDGDHGVVTLDPAADRALSRLVATRSLVLLSNRGEEQVLPMGAPVSLAVVGPLADDPFAMLGCYSFDAHVGAHHPDVAMGVRIPTVADVARERFAPVGTEVRVERTGDCESASDEQIAAAVAAAAHSAITVLVVGDNAGLFGRGTSGEGNDAPDLSLPGRQHDLVDAVLTAAASAGNRVVLVVLSGRPYALGDFADRADAIVQGFFPGEEGAEALWDVLTGVEAPSGRLPVSVPRTSGSQPGTYLRRFLAGPTEVSALDPSALYPFGHGLGYTTVDFSEHSIDATAVDTAASVTVGVTVRNTGDRAGVEIVQLYLEDVAAEVTRPVRELIGFARVDLAPGEAKRVEFAVHADRTSFTGRDLRRIVEPGTVRLQVSRSSEVDEATHTVELTGPRRVVGADRVLTTPTTIRSR